MAYPVSVTIEPSLTNRNRLTTFFRIVLAIPHAILVGPMFTAGIFWTHREGGGIGLLGAPTYFLAIVSWFTLLFADKHLRDIREFSKYYLRWRARAVAYMTLLEDPYPPFGDEPYPAAVDVADPAAPRDRVSIALRLLLAIPHAIVLFFLIIAWFITSIIAWFAILITGSYPTALYDFGAGVLRWTIRFEAYVLLLVDEYPPFAFD